jgi:pentatricopeptide repeat protein
MHSYIIRNGFVVDILLGNVLIDMYSKCNDIEDACQVFKKMPLRNVVSWIVMIVGYTQNGYCHQDLKILHNMECVGVKPHPNTIIIVLSTCS